MEKALNRNENVRRERRRHVGLDGCVVGIEGV